MAGERDPYELASYRHGRCKKGENQKSGDGQERHSDSALGAFYRRMKARHGPAKATTATAYKLARIIYSMLKKPEPYRDPGALAYEQQQRAGGHNPRRKAARLGYRLAEVPG